MKRYMRATALAGMLGVLFGIFTLTGCGGGSGGGYKAGTYTETVTGRNADITVEVTFTTSKIENIKVVKHEETKGIGDLAFDKVIPDMLKKQSATVDVATGATITSKALMEAVGLAINEAKGVTVATVDKFKPGTYTATAMGHNAPITVKITTSEDKILSCDVEGKESPGIGTAAIEILTNRLLDNQSLKLDSVSGATVTSDAFKGALDECIKQTGISRDVLAKRPIAYPAKSDSPIEESADVIIIGAGGAGFAAATTVLEEGSTVIMLEKNEYVGGNTARAGGTLNAPDPDRQKPLGIEDSPELFYENTMAAGDNYADPDLVRTLANNALDARHWLTQHGTQWTEQVYQTIGGLWPRSMDEKDKIAYNGFVAPLLKVVNDKGGKIVLNCRAYDLDKDSSGKVTIVHAKDTKNGQEYLFTAKKAVIITTGGYGAGADIVKKYDGLDKLPTSNAPTSTGDGILLGDDIGADLVGMEFVQIHPHGNPQTGGLQSEFAGVIKNSIYVNKEGKRFTEESGRRDTISNDTYKQTGHVMYSIFDSEGGFYTGVKKPANLDTLEAKGYVYEGNTIEELANKVGIDTAGLKATVDHYNEMVKAGKDTDFNKDELELEIKSAPFYAVPLSPTLHHTMGGLKINTKAQVIDKSGNIIPGLYAAGEVTGGIHGDNRVGGNALTDGVVFGRIAGDGASHD